MVQRQWASIDPIFSVDDPFIACNNPGVPPPAYIPIIAGEDITAVYWYWLHPVGPMTVWLAPCNGDCAKVDVNEVEWFKIWEAGLLTGNVPEGIWWQKQFQNWDGSPDLWPATIPLSLKPGLYMIRHEILSIHIEKKPQFYPECAHLNVTGKGSMLPPKEYLKRFPGAYDKDGKRGHQEGRRYKVNADFRSLDQYQHLHRPDEEHNELHDTWWTNMGRVRCLSTLAMPSC